MTALDLVANIDVNEEETTLSSQVLRGHASTSGDDFQLNVTTLFRHTVRTHGEQEIVYRSADGGWDRYTFDDCMKRVEAQAAFLQEIGVAPGDVAHPGADGVLPAARHLREPGRVPRADHGPARGGGSRCRRRRVRRFGG